MQVYKFQKYIKTMNTKPKTPSAQFQDLIEKSYKHW